MSFVLYDIIFLVLFGIAAGIFLFIKQKKLKREGLLFLYKTSIGLKVIDYLSKRYKKELKALSYVVVVLGYLLMALMIYFLFQLIGIFSQPELVKLIKIPPIMPLIPYLPSLFKVTWLPNFYFTYWLIAIALVAIAHEGFHGVYARLNKIRIKSTGFGFLGPFLAFFVEQDENDMKKAKIFPQLSVLGAGVFANVALGLILFIIMMAFFSLAYAPSGIVFNDYTFSVIPASLIANISLGNETVQINGMNLTQGFIENKSYFLWQEYIGEKFEAGEQVKLYQDQPAVRAGLKGAIISIEGKDIRSHEEVGKLLDKLKPGDEILIKTKYNKEMLEYNIRLGESYEQEGKAVIGIAYLEGKLSGVKGIIYSIVRAFKDPAISYDARGNADFTEFVYNFFWWLVLINFSIALVNMLPVGIFDGGRFFYLTILAVTRSEKIAKKAFDFSTYLMLLVVLLLMFLWFIRIW